MTARELAFLMALFFAVSGIPTQSAHLPLFLGRSVVGTGVTAT